MLTLLELFYGRVNRSTFIVHSLLYLGAGWLIHWFLVIGARQLFALDSLSPKLSKTFSPEQGIVVYTIYAVAVLIAFKIVQLGIKRGHDANLKWWHSALLCLSVVGLVWLAFAEPVAEGNSSSDGARISGEKLDLMVQAHKDRL